MAMTPFFVFLYMLFHYYMLNLYSYNLLSYHTLYIIFIHIYLSSRKQSSAYQIPLENVKHITTKNESTTQQHRICPKCNNIKPSRYSHCRQCNVCIYRMDHHCNWVGNCVGQFNAKTFMHYLVNLFVHSVIVLLYVFVWNAKAILYNQERSVYLLIILLPLFFIVFQTQRLLKDFYFMVKTNQTLIQSYKKVKGKMQTFTQNFTQFMGTSSFLLLTLPIYTPIQDPIKVCDLFEKTTSLQKLGKQPEDLIYADQYIYGKDDQDEFLNQNQEKTE